MPKTRNSPKSWGRRSAAYTKGTRRTTKYRRRAYKPMAITANGMRPGLGPAPYKTRFTRYSATVDWVSTSSVGVPTIATPTSSAGVTVPCTVGSPAADFSGVPNLYGFGAAWQFKLTDVVNNSDFQALFDQYKIDQIDVEVSNLHNAADATTNVNVMPTLFYAPDYDDATVPTAMSQLSERQRAKQWTFRGDGQPLKFSIKPRVLSTVYREGLTSAYQTAPPAFVDIDNSDVPYYGLKMWLSTAYITAGAPGPRGETHLRFNLKYHLSFRDPQ